jgi:cardiolipin synthase
VLRWLPNALTIARLALAIAFAWSPPGWRPAVLLAALSTEVLDGALARTFGWESQFGRMLDPVADRVLFVAVALTLLADGSLSFTSLLMLGARDALEMPGALWVTVWGDRSALARLYPRHAGKLTTALQYAAMLCIVFGVDPPALLMFATLLLGLLAAGQYGADYRRATKARSL